MKVPKIVITGGPGGGKTSGIPYLAKKLRAHAQTPIIVEEGATTVFERLKAGGGLSANPAEFQRLVLEHILAKEAEASAYAESLPTIDRPVILCDRGIYDNRAYQSRASFERFLNEYSLCPLLSRDERYDGVIHLRSAALGAEDQYTTLNNRARRESIHEARKLDERTLTAWLGHPKLRIVPNIPTESFEQKLDRAWAALAHLLGIPRPVEIERRFLVDRDQMVLPLTVPHEVVQIEQVYLISDGERIRSRAAHGRTIYSHAKKSALRRGVREEIEKSITHAEYLSFLENRDPTRGTIMKERHHFVWNNQHFELDIFQRPAGISILEIELLEEHEPVTLPPFIPLVCEITHDKKFTNHRLSKRA
ncbi:MAG: AAA family ATPase [Patescibacteria group bacterium]